MAGFSVIAFLIGLFAALSGCGTCPADDSSPSGADIDGDGWTAEAGDCNDADPAVHPGAPDTVGDGRDNDCDGGVDEGGNDSDGDGYADESDCDRCNNSVYPFAEELCDEIDNNCNGVTDEACDGASEWDECTSIPMSTRMSAWARSFFTADKVAEEGCEDDGTPQMTATPTPEEETEPTSTTTPEPTVIPTEAPEPTATPTPEPTSAPTPCQDEDGDGYDNCNPGDAGDDGLQVDCFPTEEAVHPGATEVCNEIDDDCDGQKDEEARKPYYVDGDKDGYGKAGSNPVFACSQPDGWAANDDDCNDTDASINPGAEEITCNEIDENCNGVEDDRPDEDTDGYSYCPTGGSEGSWPGDCNDLDSGIHPDAEDVCNGIDEDCDGSDGPPAEIYLDADEDGYGAGEVIDVDCVVPGTSSRNDDCDDTDPTANPGADEVCDGVDNDCDTLVDEVGTTTFFVDEDSDGYGSESSTTQACTAPSGYSATDNDCNDTNPNVNPGATESCDTADNDCDEQIDEGFDADSDGYTVCGGDCNDVNASVNTAKAEVTCNGANDDCSASTDDSPDADSDGYDICAAGVSGADSNASDCNDVNSGINPGKTETTCNGVNEDCNSTTDDSPDADSDGYDICAIGVIGADVRVIDCDDENSEVNPGATEVCNFADDDCDGVIDDGLSSQKYYDDADDDGFGDPGDSTQACSAPEGHVSNNGDCDDTDPTVNPGATEVCDGIDNDCDGAVDGADAADEATYYEDLDSDGYGTTESTTQACSKPSGYAAQPGDCDDGDASVNPGASETCNYEDDDCDASVDEGTLITLYADGDLDGYGNPENSSEFCVAPHAYVFNDDDCDDTDANVHPGANEFACDGIDQDCDGYDESAHGLWFEQSTARVEVADDPSLDQGLQFTWEAWVDPQWAESGGLLFSRWEQEGREDWGCGVDGSNASVQCSFLTTDGTYAYVNSGPDQMGADWVHVAFVYKNGSELRLYINGILVGSKPETRMPASGGAPFTVGGSIREETIFAPLWSIMRELRLSSVARYTEDEFTPDFVLGVDGNTTLLLPLDDGYGSVAADVSEYENDGEVIGAYWATASCPSDAAAP